MFLKKSESKNPHERNRSLYILQRIKDEHIIETITDRWDAFSNSEIEKQAKQGSTRIMFELMLYGRKNCGLVEKSILKTLTEKKLPPNVLTEYLNILSSFIGRDHDTKIDDAVINILLKTKNKDVANYASAVLQDSRTTIARNGLIRGLDHKDAQIRATIAQHLITRYDFNIQQDVLLLERILSDSSLVVFQYAYSALTWKEPNAEQCAVIVQILLNYFSTNKKPQPKKVYVFLHFYYNLNQEFRESIKVENSILVLQSINEALNSPEFDRISLQTTKRIYEKMYGIKEMVITPMEFWRGRLGK